MTLPAITLTADTVRPLSAADYEHERAAMADALRGCGASAVYEIGSLGHPGISDLDLVARFPDAVELRKAQPAVADRLRCARAFLHAPWAVHDRHWPAMPTLFAVRAMRDLATGEQVPVEPQNPVQRLLWNAEAAASVLAVLQSRSRVTTRSALCLLNGVRYNIALAGCAAAGSRAATFAERITALRGSWFATAPELRERELVTTWSLAIGALEDVLAAEAAAVRRSLHGSPGDASMRVPGTGLVYDFRGVGHHAARSLPFTTRVRLPRELGALFALASAPGTGLDRWLRVAHRRTDWRADAGFAAEVATCARATARYVADMVQADSPFLLLGGGTLAHVQSTRTRRFLGLLCRVGRRLAPARAT